MSTPQQPEQQAGSKSKTCGRCLESLDIPYFVKFVSPDEEYSKMLCQECYEIAKHALSPDSWKYTDPVMEAEKRKLYYFDKSKKEQ